METEGTVKRVSAIAPARESPWLFAFDMAAGILAPVLVLRLDLTLGENFLPMRPLSSTAAFGCMAAFAAWYPFRNRDARWQLVAAGPLLCGALYASIAGVGLFPLACMGVMVRILHLDTTPFLGFVPLFTGVVFIRATSLAWTLGRGALPTAKALGIMLLSAALFGSLCLWGGRLVATAEEDATDVIAGIRVGDRAAAERTLRILREVPGVTLEGLLGAARKSEADRSPQSPRSSWERVTGNTYRPYSDD